MESKIGQAFIEQAVRHLTVDFLPKIGECLGRLSDEQIWWRPNEVSNSCGNLILHLCGNVRQWILSGVGGQPDVRKRSLEFSQREPLGREDLQRRLEGTVSEAVEVLNSLDETELLETHTIQIYTVSTLQAVFHVVEHFSYHTGQIAYITKLLTSDDLGFYAQLNEKHRRF